MRYLKTLNELFKSTYKSASDKLGGAFHSKRKEDLLKHAAKVGTDVPTSKSRLWSFRFILHDSSLEGEFYSIVNVEYSYDGSNKHDITIVLESNYRNLKKIPLTFYGRDTDIRYSYNYRFQNEDSKVARKNAFELRKFFLEYLEGNIARDEKVIDPPANLANAELQNFTVNNLYRS